MGIQALSPVTVASISLAVVGFDFGAVGAAMPLLRDNLGMLLWQESLATAITYFIGAVGGLFCGYLADAYGRRYALLWAVGLVTFGSAVSALSPNVATLLLGRSILGVGSGLIQTTTPILVAETASSEDRGYAVACTEAMLNAGVIIGAGVGFAFCNMLKGWRYMFLINAVGGLVVGLYYLPTLQESPRWLATQQRAALKTGSSSGSGSSVPVAERQSLKGSGGEGASEEQDVPIAPWSTVLCPRDVVLRRILLVGLGVSFFSQATGTDLALFYSPEIISPELNSEQSHDYDGAHTHLDLKHAEGLLAAANSSLLIQLVAGAAAARTETRMFDPWDPATMLVAARRPFHPAVLRLFESEEDFGFFRQAAPGGSQGATSIVAGMSEFRIMMLCSIAFATMQLFSVMMASVFFDKLGRKPFLLGGSLALAVSHATILAGRLLRSKIVVGLGVMGVIVVFNASYSALTPVICTEIFPMHVRAKGTSLAFFTEQIVLGTLLLVYFPLEGALPATGVWPFFVVISLLAFVFVWYYVPETSGKSLEEVYLVFSKEAGSPARETSAKQAGAKSYGTAAARSS